MWCDGRRYHNDTDSYMTFLRCSNWQQTKGSYSGRPQYWCFMTTAERSYCLSGFICQCRTACRELAVSTLREVQGSNIELENAYSEIFRYYLGLFKHGKFFKIRNPTLLLNIYIFIHIGVWVCRRVSGYGCRGVTIDRVWNGYWIYWPLIYTIRNYK
jgi:hypothetical protein